VRTKKSLKNRNVLVAVTGSVAAYKSVDLVREIKRRSADVRVIMTPDATRFVTPLSLQLASGNEVICDMFEHPLSHIELPRWGEVFVVAPATASTLGKFASALAPDIVSACFLAFQGPVLVAPAMNWRMYTNPVVQDRLEYLRSRGIQEIPPEQGGLACGEEGIGRMASINAIISEIENVLHQGVLKGKKIVVTAGPTREYIDPIRFISNRSSGKMGFAVARAARRLGGDVVLVTGPSSLISPDGVETVRVETATQMCEAVMDRIQDADVLVMAAAVADFTPSAPSRLKIDKKKLPDLKLERSVDILHRVSEMKKRPFVVGFAAETGQNKDRAREKMKKKKMDFVVFNDVCLEGAGFDTDTNKVILIDGASEEDFPLMSKDELAMVILERIVGKLP